MQYTHALALCLLIVPGLTVASAPSSKGKGPSDHVIISQGDDGAASTHASHVQSEIGDISHDVQETENQELYDAHVGVDNPETTAQQDTQPEVNQPELITPEATQEEVRDDASTGSDAEYYDVNSSDSSDETSLCQVLKDSISNGYDNTVTFVADHPVDLVVGTAATASIGYLAFYAYQYWLSELNYEPSKYERWAMYVACVGVATSAYYAAYRNDIAPHPIPHIAFDFYTAPHSA